MIFNFHKSQSANLEAFVCIKLNLDEWTEEDVDNVIKLVVNEAINSKYEDNIPENRKKPQPDSSIEERSDFIRRKHVMQQFLNMEEQLSCPFNPAAFNCSSTGINSVVEKKFCPPSDVHHLSNLHPQCCYWFAKRNQKSPDFKNKESGFLVLCSAKPKFFHDENCAYPFAVDSDLLDHIINEIDCDFGGFPVFVTYGNPSLLKSHVRIMRFFQASDIDLASLP
ncbi:hypothetical protein L1887_25666 [Cichorium endivia]|nr:hypothetical protein L1887_25666 [Cichorium endivia]